VFVDSNDNDLVGGFWFGAPHWRDVYGDWHRWPDSDSEANDGKGNWNLARSKAPCRNEKEYSILDDILDLGGEFFMGSTDFYWDSMDRYNFKCESQPLF
jgi:hypothetical protein